MPVEKLVWKQFFLVLVIPAVSLPAISTNDLKMYRVCTSLYPGAERRRKPTRKKYSSNRDKDQRSQKLPVSHDTAPPPNPSTLPPPAPPLAHLPPPPRTPRARATAFIAPATRPRGGRAQRAAAPGFRFFLGALTPTHTPPAPRARVTPGPTDTHSRAKSYAGRAHPRVPPGAVPAANVLRELCWWVPRTEGGEGGGEARRRAFRTRDLRKHSLLSLPRSRPCARFFRRKCFSFLQKLKSKT